MPISLTGSSQLARDRQRDAPARGSVELGQHDAGDAGRVGEQLRLAQPVLAGRRVDRQQRLVRGALQLAADHAADLGELGHQIVLGVQASGRVDDHHVAALRVRAGDRLERDRARV